MIQRNQQTGQDVCSRFRLFFIEGSPSSHHFLLVLNVGQQNLTQRQNLRHSILNSQHIEAEIGLHLSQLEKVIENDMSRGITTNLNYKTNSFTVGLITNSCDAINAFFLHQTNNVLMDLGLINHVWKLGYDNSLTAIFHLFDFSARTKNN